MASSTELARTQVVTRDGIVTATLLDRVGTDRIFLMLTRGAAAARYGRVEDSTPRTSKQVRDLLVQPRREDG